MSSIIPTAVVNRISDELLDSALNATAEIALAYAGLQALAVVARNGAVAQAAGILGEYLAPLMVGSASEHKPIEVPENVRKALAPYAMLTGSVIPLRVPPPPVSPRSYADGYRAGRRSLQPLLDHQRIHGRSK